MNTEEKAKAYDDALEKAKKELKTCGSMDCDAARQIFRFFPELKENKSEKIIEDLIATLKLHLNGMVFMSKKQRDAYITYLEKQKELFSSGIGLYYYDGEKTTYCGYPVTEENPYDLIMSQQERQKPILEVFGFKVGDTVRLKDGDGRKHIIKSFEEVEGLHGPNFYHVEFEDNSARDSIYPGEQYPNGYYTQMEKFEEEHKPAEWSDKEDEKLRKDLIWTINGLTFMPEQKKEAYITYLEKQKETLRDFIDNFPYSDEQIEQKPVEIHIDNPNIQKADPDMKITTSDSSASGDELLYVSNKSYNIGYRDGKREAGQKPTEWSEEDERIRKALVEYHKQQFEKNRDQEVGLFHKDAINWLKSLRPQPKQEWSEEDEEKLERVDDLLWILDSYIGDDCSISEEITQKLREEIENVLCPFLKSLRPQPKRDRKDCAMFLNGECTKPSWKPSKEQMEAFKGYIEDFQEKAEAAVGGWNNFDVMIRLYEQLKKL